MANYIILVNYKDTSNRTGTARLKVRGTTPQDAITRAKKELAEIEKYCTKKNIRRFNLDTIQVIQQSNSASEEGLLIIRKKTDPGFEVWEFKGTIDAYTNRQFEAIIEDAKHEGAQKIIFDLSGVSYINSTGIGTIISSLSELKVRLANVPQKISEVFTVIGLDDLIDIYYSVEEAATGF